MTNHGKGSSSSKAKELDGTVRSVVIDRDIKLFLCLPINNCPEDRHLNNYVRGKVCAAGPTKWQDLGVHVGDYRG